MPIPQWTRQSVLQNTLLRHIARKLGELWFPLGSGSLWRGNFTEGFSTWSGDDGNEFFVIWNKNSFLVAASITECDRMYGDDEDEWEWDEERDPEGLSRGLEFLGKVPADIMKFYKKLLIQSEAQFITAGFYGIGDEIFFQDSYDIAVENGLDYFEEYDLPLDKFLHGKPNQNSLAEIFSFDGPLERAPLVAEHVTKNLIDKEKELISEDDMLFLKSKITFSELDKRKPSAVRLKAFVAEIERIRESLQ